MDYRAHMDTGGMGGVGPGMMGMHQGAGMGPGMMGQPMMGGGMMGGRMEGMPMGAGPGMMMGNMMGAQMLGPMVEGRLAFMKSALAITDAQAQAWDTFANTVRGRVGDISNLMRDMRAMHEGPVPRRIDMHIMHIEKILEGLKALKPPVDTLYAALSDEQKSKADALASMGPMM